MQHYKNLNLEASGYKNNGTNEQFKVRILNTKYAMEDHEAIQVKLPSSKIRSYKRILARGKLKEDELIDFGTELGKALFPGQVHNAIHESIGQLKSGQGLRIRLILNHSGLASLPWEFVCLQSINTTDELAGPQCFLALDRRVSLVRYELKGDDLGDLNPGVEPIRLVALMSNPDDDIDVDEELKILKEVAAEVPEFHVDPYPQATIGSLTEALSRSPHILHFSGHGKFEGYHGENYGSEEGKGAIILEGEDNRANPLDATGLAVNLRGKDICLVTLNACLGGKVDAANDWDGVATALMKAGIPAVIGMQFKICDENARLFSKAFYRALVAGKPIDAAVTDGRMEIRNDKGFEERDWGVPVLYMRDTDGVLFPTDLIGPVSIEIKPRILRKAMEDTLLPEDINNICRDMREKLREQGKTVPRCIPPAPGQIYNRISDLIECLRLEDPDELSHLQVLYDYFGEEEGFNKVISQYKKRLKDDNP